MYNTNTPTELCSFVDQFNDQLWEWAYDHNSCNWGSLSLSKANKAVIKQLKQQSKTQDFTSPYRLNDIMAAGVTVFGKYCDLGELVQPICDLIQKDRPAVTILDVNWVASWGIVQHEDGNSDVTILIPLNYQHFCFAHTKYNPREDRFYTKQQDWNELTNVNKGTSPIAFVSSLSHSLAPKCRVSKPFTGVIIDIGINYLDSPEVKP